MGYGDSSTKFYDHNFKIIDQPSIFFYQFACVFFLMLMNGKCVLISTLRLKKSLDQVFLMKFERLCSPSIMSQWMYRFADPKCNCRKKKEKLFPEYVTMISWLLYCYLEFNSMSKCYRLVTASFFKLTTSSKYILLIFIMSYLEIFTATSVF